MSDMINQGPFCQVWLKLASGLRDVQKFLYRQLMPSNDSISPDFGSGKLNIS